MYPRHIHIPIPEVYPDARCDRVIRDEQKVVIWGVLEHCEADLDEFRTNTHLFTHTQGQNLWCGMRVREKPSCVCDGDKCHVFVTFLLILVSEVYPDAG